MHGIKQACKCLGLDITSLTNYEAASIIARLKYPKPRYRNRKSVIAVNQRTNYIVNRFNQLNSKGQYGTV